MIDIDQQADQIADQILAEPEMEAWLHVYPRDHLHDIVVQALRALAGLGYVLAKVVRK